MVTERPKNKPEINSKKLKMLAYSVQRSIETIYLAFMREFLMSTRHNDGRSHRERIFENRALRTIFGPKRNDITGE